MPTYFFSTEELSAFVDELCADLEAAGFTEAADRLAEVQRTPYTTGSEWLGALQHAVTKTRRQRGLPPALDARLQRLLEPPYAERVARRQYWAVVFYSAVVLMLLVGVAALGLLAEDDGERYAVTAMAGLAVVLAMLWVSVRKISVCAGCGLRSQRPALAWCPFCGMRRFSGSPGPRIRPVAGTPPSPLTVCPGCRNPPGGRSRYGRALPSEGQFCGSCGTQL